MARDSLNVDALPEIARSDWLEGDTIIVTFEPTTPVPSEGGAATADTAQSDYRIKRIVARVRARSLYRLIPSDTTALPGVDAPAIHYVTGDEITIIMNEGEADQLEVQGRTHGFHLEPLSSAESDSLGLDSATIDTTVIADSSTARDTVPNISSGSSILGSKRLPQPPRPILPRVSGRAAILHTWRWM
ncbi:MAG TPA: hypothetical protein EYM97_05065 [Gemmatimonadetes bacterium]|nr:hypothetical protein [Gemmatimonadota bacterium]